MKKSHNYEITSTHNVPIKSWTKGVPFESEAKQQLKNIANLPFIFKWVAVMPDVHLGKGAAIGAVIPTIGAVIPAAVGVDIGCGMIAVKTSLNANDLPNNLTELRAAIEKSVPHGSSAKRGGRDKGAWQDYPEIVVSAWKKLEMGFKSIIRKHPIIEKSNNINHIGTLGGGNHFIEICLDQADAVWIMLHSGSRGVGNLIGNYFIELAKKDMQKNHIHLADADLAYLNEGTQYFRDYVEAVEWAQRFAALNREVMMQRVIAAMAKTLKIVFSTHLEAINCHHNYVTREKHFGTKVFITRKGAVRAGKGELGIIPGSMGAKSYIVRGLGNEESFQSCSHGAGRVMSRNAAKKNISLAEHIKATEGVECLKDKSVIDESPAAYKSIDAVLTAQKDLVEVMYTLKQIICVKG